METINKRKVTTRTWLEKKTLCEEWKASGKTKSEFCKDKDIPLATFFPWCNKLWPESKKQSTNILPVKIINKSRTSLPVSIEQTEVELLVGTSTKMRFKLPVKVLVTFIQELSHAIATIR